MPPALSIITPSLNQAKYLPDCLRSVREQGVTMAGAGGDGDIEHIVIDGGSTDGSADLIARAPGLAWSVSEPDRGQSDAINKGMGLDSRGGARGEWATWLNADDWFEPEALPRMLAALRADPGIDVLVGRCRFVDLEGRTIFDPRPPDPINLANLLKLRSQWFNGRLIVQPEAFFRLSLFREVGGLNLDNHYTMDHELWLKLLQAKGGKGKGGTRARGGARFEAIDIPVACMRAHPEQKTADNTRIVRCMLRFARPIYEAARADGSLGDEAADVAAELDAIERKLADADLVEAHWDAVERQPAADSAPAGGSTGATAGAPEGLECRWAQRALPDEAIQLAAPHIRAALRHAPMEGRVAALDPSGGDLLRRLAPQLADPPRRLFRRPQRPVQILSGLPAVSGLEPGRLDAIMTCCALVQLDDPRDVLHTLQRALRPGGRLLLLAETIPSPDLPAYLAHLRALMSAQLSQNHDTLISAEAAAWIASLRAQGAPGEHAATAPPANPPTTPATAPTTTPTTAPANWARAHPSARGVDLAAIATSLGMQIEFARPYGGLWYHPLTPFPEIERDVPPAADSWMVALWRKPKAP